MILKVKRLHNDAKIPHILHENDAGFDLYSAESTTIAPGESKLIKTGISIELPPSTEAQVRPRSGLALKHQITVLNTPGTIDEGYRGEVGVILINHGKQEFSVENHMRIAQMVIKPTIHVTIEEAKELSDTKRGSGGFGSTGH